MQSLRLAAKLALILMAPLTARSQRDGPLIIERQGSFFVGGENKSITVPASTHLGSFTGEITVNQMYVQYQVPRSGDQHIAVAMIHGCCLSGKTWETTPDGRMGWSEYFLRKDRSVYLVDQVSRARSGFDPSQFYKMRFGTTPRAELPEILIATHERAWTSFRLGPKYGEVFPDQQFPVQAAQEFYKQLIPDLSALAPTNANATWFAMAALSQRLKGVVFIAHSQSGFFPERAALLQPNEIRGIISIETQCEKDLAPETLSILARVPILIVFGDHLDDVTLKIDARSWTWGEMLTLCNTFIDELRRVGGDAEMMHLPSHGIKGNSHMLMQDRNNIQIADLILSWIERHVESKQKDGVRPTE